MRSKFLWFAALVSALGGFLFGYDWVVIGGAKPFYEAYFDLTSTSQEAWAMSCALLGCLLGAIVSGVLSDYLGRRRALLLSATLFGLSALGTGMAHGYEDFVFWRIMGGCAIGLASALSPLYIAEIAPARIRGRLVCLNELTIVLGILAAQTTNWLIALPMQAGVTRLELQRSWNGQVAWRHMFEAAFVPSALFFAGLFVLPESPRWLALKGRWQGARQVLCRLHGSQDAEQVIGDMRAAFRGTTEKDLRSALKEKSTRRVLLIGITLAVLQQWCGINVLFNYAQDVFTAAGYSLSNMFFNIVITGMTMCFFTFAAVATVESFGRRKLMILGCGVLAALYTMLGGLYRAHLHGVVLLVTVMAAIAAYATTLAPITWVILSEIFPTEVRGAFMAICTAALWSACFLLTYSFPTLNAAMGTAGTFWIYAAICALGLAFVVWQLPETKRRSLEDAQTLWMPAQGHEDAVPIEIPESTA